MLKPEVVAITVLKSESTSRSIIWKFLERFGYHGAQLLTQIILARVLEPEAFGTVGIVLVFITFSNIFVQSGFNTALIQNKASKDRDFSSVLWLSLLIAGLFYFLLFAVSPAIASYYNNNAICDYLRIMGIMLFGGAVNSVQIAYASKNGLFKLQFYSNTVSVIISSAVSIAMALKGCGIWSIVAQQIVWQYASCVAMTILLSWKPSFVFDFNSITTLFSFGWKMFVSNLMIRINSMVSELIIGKRFSSEVLGYYSKGLNIPTPFSDVVVNAISSVSLVSFSNAQNDIEKEKQYIKEYIQHSFFFIAPIIMGLFGISRPLVSILLTDKWLPCVPYLRIFCILYLFQPICAIYAQAVSGIGRSDLYLKAILISKPIGLLAILIVSKYCKSAAGVAIVVVLTSVFEAGVHANSVNKMFGYKIKEQIKAWLPNVINSLIMLLAVLQVQKLQLPAYAILITQIAVGAAAYFAVSVIFKNPTYLILKSKLLTLIKTKCE